MKTHLGIFGSMILVLGIFASPLFAGAQTYQQVVSTDIGTLKVGISTDPASPKPGESSKMKIDFLNPKTNTIQEHIDYSVLVTNGGNSVFGPIPLTHTSLGTATIPVQFKDGENKVVIDIQGILFRPIPSEKASFSITLGDTAITSQEKPKVDQKSTKTDKAKDTESNKKDLKDSKKDKKKEMKKKVIKKTVKKPTKNI
jgi:hypothetical protein